MTPASLITGLLTGFVGLVTALSLAALIFSGDLTAYLPQGIRMALISAVVPGTIIALTSSCRRIAVIPHAGSSAVLAVVAALVIERMPPSASPDAVFLSVTATILIATLLTAVLWVGLGYFRVGSLIRFLPFSVIGGFLAGTGWMLVLGGLRVLTRSPLDSPASLAAMVQPDPFWRWLPGVCIGLALYLASRHRRHAAAVPAVILLSTAGFYIAALAAGHSTDDLLREGWLLGPLDDAPTTAWNPLFGVDWGQIHLPAIAANLANLATVPVISSVALLLTMSALELWNRKDLDVNRELRISGVANLVGGASGGMVAFYSPSLSGMAAGLGGTGRSVGLLAAAVCALGFWAGPELLGYLPRPLLGGILCYLGIVFLYEWLVKAWGRFPRAEYAIIPLILFFVATSGFLTGMIAGLLAAVALFVVNYSRVDVVRYALPGCDRRSTVERPPEQEQVLKSEGGMTHILALQGYLFFGTTRTLLGCIRMRISASDKKPLAFLVLDFKHVTGLDSSATLSFVKLMQIAEQEGFRLAFSNLRPEMERRLRSGGVRHSDTGLLGFFPDLDHALEWCEDQILVLSPPPPTGTRGILQQITARMPSADAGDEFLDFLEKIEVPAGYTLVRQGDPSDEIFFVEDGEVSIYLETRGGERVRVRRTEAGTVVGEIGFYLKEQRSASAVTDGPATLYRLSVEALERMEAGHPEVALEFHRFMAALSSQRLLSNTRTFEALAD